MPPKYETWGSTPSNDRHKDEDDFFNEITDHNIHYDDEKNKTVDLLTVEHEAADRIIAKKEAQKLNAAGRETEEKRIREWQADIEEDRNDRKSLYIKGELPEKRNKNKKIKA